jgi:hypothetical protein
MSNNDAETKAMEILSQMGTEYREAQGFIDFQPEDGQYLSVLSDVRFGFFFGGTGADNAGFTLDGILQDEPYVGQKHSLGTFTKKNFGFLKKIIARLGGGEMENAADAGHFLKDFIGKVLLIDVSTRPAKNGKEYTNANIVGLAELEADDQADPFGTPQTATTE